MKSQFDIKNKYKLKSLILRIKTNQKILVHQDITQPSGHYIPQDRQTPHKKPLNSSIDKLMSIRKIRKYHNYYNNNKPIH